MGVLSEIQKDLNLEVVALFGECHDALLSEARALCNDDSGAEDLVMRTFEAYCKSRDNFDPGKGSWLSWLRGIMRNLHHNSSRGKAVGCMVYMTPEELAQIQDREVGSGEADDAVLRNSDAEVVRNAIGGLSPDMREVIVLRYFEDLPISRIAQILGASENSVKCRLYYARKILAKRLGGKLGKKSLALLLAAILGVGTLFGAWFSPLGDWVAEKVFGNAPAEAAEVAQAEPVQSDEDPAAPSVTAPTDGTAISETQKQESEGGMNIGSSIKKAVAKTVATAAVAAMAVGLPANAEAGAPTGLRIEFRNVTLTQFAWFFFFDSAGEGASAISSWKVEYGLKSDFSDARVSMSGTTIRNPNTGELSETTHQNLPNGTTYYLRGTAVNNLGEEAVVTTSVTTLSPTPDTITKFEFKSAGFTSASFSREMTVGTGATATTVWMDYGTDPEFADCRVFTEMLSWNKTKTTWTVEGLLPNTTYYARLRSTNTNNMDAQSEMVTFTTAAEGAVAPSVTTNGIYEILVYTKSGWYVAQEDETVEYLVVGGGGGSGGYIGGGAGGGGVIHVTETNLTAGTYAVGVGTGGTAGNGGKNGGDSYFADSYAFGGGASGYWDHNYANAGGSGGGNVRKVTGGAGVEGQGFAGGNCTGEQDIASGGGGATEPGGTGDTTTRVCGKGGDGYDCDITGEWHCYGSGGGGGDISRKDSRTYAAPGGKESGGHGRTVDGTVSQTDANGVDGLGGGGGGGCYVNSSDTGGKGGSGTVIIKRVWLKESPEPTLTKGVEVKDLTRSGVTLSLFVDMLGRGATSATVKLFVAPVDGEYPSVPSASKQITAAGETVEMTLTGTSKAAYKAYFVVENDCGKSTATDPIEFTLLGLKIKATGGDIVKEVGDYKIHIFTNVNETATFDVMTGGPADILIVGGGGGGGGIGGGGGGGGVIALTNVAVAVGSYSVVIGKGGTAGRYNNLRGGLGGETTFYGRTAFGGGGGGTWDMPGGWTGMDGASGGGGSSTYDGGKGIDGQGHKGGTGGPDRATVGGGGGGAMQDGGFGTATAGSGKGGDGFVTTISGDEHCYGSGGGGGAHSSRNTEVRAPGGRESGGAGGANGPAAADKNGLDGVDTLGGGGGGGGQGGSCGKGGSGVVVIRYKIRNIVPGFAIIVK